ASFGDVLSVGRWTPKGVLAHDRLHPALHNDPPSRVFPFAPVTFSPNNPNHRIFSFNVPHFIVPNHQGGNAANLGTLFATNRGDRSNLKTERTPSSTPQLQDVPKSEGLDFTDNLQSMENYSQDAKTTRSVVEVKPTSLSYMENSSKQPNHTTTSSSVRSTILPNAHSRGQQIIFQRFVTPSPILQLTTKGSNLAVPGDVAPTGGAIENGCLSLEHRFHKRSCYVIIRKRDSFMRGLNTCMNINAQAHSAIINDPVEGYLLKAYYMNEGVNVWLGLHRRGADESSDVFKWLDDSSLTYTNWGHHEPGDHLRPH
ncbi:C-type lectin fold, partial [Trinorchestia longiramus]